MTDNAVALGANSELDKERLYAVINTMTDGVLALDADLKVLLSNGVALGVLDVNSANGRRLDDLLKLSDKTGKPILLSEEIRKKHISPHDVITSRDWQLKYDDGTVAYLFISISALRTSFGRAGGGFVVLLRDITQEKTLEEERDEFISVAAHELRTPVAIAEGQISNTLIAAKTAPVPDSIKTSLASAHEQVVFLSNMLNDLSTLSRAERGKLAASHEQFDADELVKSLLQDFRPQALEKKLEFSYEGDEVLGKIVNSRLYVREILQNFITNAIKYTERGSIKLQAKKLNDAIEFTVADTGIGVGRNEQAKINQKFFRSSDYRVKKINGTGLGLYVSHKLARLIGGKISFDSELNQGSCFRLIVPAQPPAEASTES